VRKNPGVGNGDDEAAELIQQVKVLKLTVEDLEKERDFYFGKLRNIELICQENEGENDPVLQRIVDILYATDVSIHMKILSFHFANSEKNKFNIVGFSTLC
jgi:RP/EB family microtubule-associated protein